MDKKADAPQTQAKNDIEYLKGEFREFLSFLNKQVFNQIPSVSAVAGLITGAWVASTFTASPIKGALAKWGFTDGATHVVSSGTYKFLSLSLPIIATGLTAYAVQKALKAFREMQIEVSIARASGLSEKSRAELGAKLAALEHAREAGILSWNEYRAKMASIYQPYVKKTGSKVEELIVSKVTAKIQ